MSDLHLLRDRLVVADRQFAVYGEPWFDPDAEEWRGRILFLPLDRSLPRALASEAVNRFQRREDLLASLRALRDRELRRALLAVALTPTGRT